MPERPVVAVPNPVLKQVAVPVGAAPALSCDALRRLAADLVDTMRVSPGCVGLAAPQIGVARRGFCVDVSGHPSQLARAGAQTPAARNHGLIVLFDPELLHAGDSLVRREGCMSVPDLTADVRRALRVVVRGTGPDGRERVVDAEGFEARAVQHELDHLDGLLILDRVASLHTDVFRRRVYQPRRAPR
ncbi:MAG TPA: peptide deformylase [Egibacteraceae bacterium]|nr:peptide deformylase [Actinomycetota bacterium]HWB71532.1 peptide deformylase [Egibacteraceae bacterium]